VKAIRSFLEEKVAGDELAGLELPHPLTALLVTPRFKASAHVVYLLLSKGRPEPRLVAKVSRMPGHSDSLEREWSNLEAFRARWPEGADTAPRAIRFDRYDDHAILLETALVGQAMDPARVRRDPEQCCRSVLTWLTALGNASHQREQPAGWFERLVAEPLDIFEALVPPTGERRQLLERTRELAEPLRNLYLPLPFEHGDLSHPNLLLLEGGRAGVLDWEVAIPSGLPACDLFFFLTYVAFARHRSRARGNYLHAFRSAFFDDRPWTRPYVQEYARALSLPEAALTPLFVLTWARHVTSLLTRLPGVSETPPLPPPVLKWLEANRFYALWQEAVARANGLSWLPQFAGHQGGI
jgi:aminoglycoside phosphotransferase